MPYKSLFIVIFLLFSIADCFSQANQVNIEKKNQLADRVIERFFVSPSAPNIKDGPYKAFYRRRTVIADGNYTKGQRTGIWHFYDIRGELIQTYNFDKDSLEFEGREKAGSDFHYLIDEEISDTDRITKPVHIGGRCYGFLPYLNVFKAPFETYDGSAQSFIAAVELLISPMGRLAEYKVHLMAPEFGYDQTFTLSLAFFKDDEKEFIPATFNYKPILSRIIIKCKVMSDGGLDFF
jgi:hypothetical protein